jgi:Spy/CpxP family protein refolding chaperone
MMGGGPGCGMHQGMRGRGGLGDGMGVQMILRHADDIKLTDEQKDKLEGMIADFKTESIDARAALEKARVELGDLMRRDAAESDVMSGIDKVARLRADMQKMRYRHHQQVKGVLTDEQVQQLKDLRRDFGKRMFQRWNDDDDNGSPGPGRRGGRG